MAGNRWVRIDTGFLQNRKVLRVGQAGALLHLAAIFYLGSEQDENGILPGEMVPALAQLCGIRNPEPVVERLVKNDLWHAFDRDYIVHDYDAMNGARSEAGHARARQQRRREKFRAERDQAP